MTWGCSCSASSITLAGLGGVFYGVVQTVCQFDVEQCCVEAGVNRHGTSIFRTRSPGRPSSCGRQPHASSITTISARNICSWVCFKPMSGALATSRCRRSASIRAKSAERSSNSSSAVRTRRRSRKLPFTPRAKRAIELADEDAQFLATGSSRRPSICSSGCCAKREGVAGTGTT